MYKFDKFGEMLKEIIPYNTYIIRKPFSMVINKISGHKFESITPIIKKNEEI